MIGQEIRFLGASFLWGLVLMSCYDALRILRKILPHPFLLTALEDVVYWLVGGVLVFRMIYAENYGTIRGYSVVALLFGMVLYYLAVGEKLVRLVAGVWDRAWGRTVKVAVWCTRPLRKMMLPVVKITKIIKKALKSIKKTVTIACKHT